LSFSTVFVLVAILVTIRSLRSWRSYPMGFVHGVFAMGSRAGLSNAQPMTTGSISATSIGL
jgi:hypothetical protein